MEHSSRAVRNQEPLLRLLAVCPASLFELILSGSFSGKQELLKALKEIFLNVSSLSLPLTNRALEERIKKKERRVSALVFKGEKTENAAQWVKERRLVQEVLKDLYSVSSRK